MQLQTICFCATDISFLIELINRNISIFEALAQYDSFQKTINEISKQGHKILGLLKNEKESGKRNFYIIFQNFKNSQLEKLFRHKNKFVKDSKDESEEAENELLIFKIKDCIKKILKGLNVLNNKDFSYLN